MRNDVFAPPNISFFSLKASPVSLSHSQIKDLLCCKLKDPLVDAKKKIALHLLVDEAPATLKYLDQQINEMRQTLDSLVQKRQLFESDFDNAKTILHSIRSMPPDVLKEIFVYCVPNWDEMVSGLDGPDCDSLHPRWRPQWTISHVSRTWRDISVLYPRLWSRLRLDFRKYRALSMRAVTTQVALLLERSKNMGLFMALTKSFSDHPAFALLDPSAPRWRKLILYLLRPRLQALSGTSFSRLEELSGMAIPTNRDAMHTPVNTFRTAPPQIGAV